MIFIYERFIRGILKKKHRIIFILIYVIKLYITPPLSLWVGVFGIHTRAHMPACVLE